MKHDLYPILALILGLPLVAHAHKFYRKAEHDHVREIIEAQVAQRSVDRRSPLLYEHIPRQATSSASSQSVTTGTISDTQSFSFSLAATNPTAIPLESINSAAPSAPTGAIPVTPQAGDVPTNVESAPGIPAPSPVIASYPALDRVPPVDSPEVQQWIAEVQSSGVEIPSFAPTLPGGCPSNPEDAQDPNRCWWTCSGCVRDTDIDGCPETNTWGLSYDDGPAPYTPDLLEYLSEKDLRATFFVVGSRALQFPSMLQYEYLQGHQISVHTWSHHALTTLTNEEIIAELGWTKKIIHDVLGVTPNTMRPPFGDIDDRVRAICTAMGLTPILWTRISQTQTLDTDDFDVHAGTATVDEVLFNWQNILGNVSQLDSGFIVLEHDLFQQTVQIATGYILPDALARNQFKIMPIAECLNRRMADSYIETNDNVTNPPPVSGAPGSTQSPDTVNSATSLQEGGSSLGRLYATLGLLVCAGIRHFF